MKLLWLVNLSPPNVHPPEIDDLMIRIYENPWVSLKKAGYSTLMPGGSVDETWSEATLASLLWIAIHLVDTNTCRAMHDTWLGTNNSVDGQNMAKPTWDGFEMKPWNWEFDGILRFLDTILWTVEGF